MITAMSTFGLFVFSFVMLVLALTMYAILVHKQWTASRWPTVQGTILSAGLKSRWIADNSTDNSSGRYFQASVSFDYVVDGKRYQSNRHGRSGVWLGSEKSAKKTAARFKEGEAVAVYFDPKNPQRSMIWPHIGWVNGLVVLIPFVLCLLTLQIALS
jgi:Protein of unknown function (DUF3592)